MECLLDPVERDKERGRTNGDRLPSVGRGRRRWQRTLVRRSVNEQCEEIDEILVDSKRPCD